MPLTAIDHQIGERVRRRRLHLHKSESDVAFAINVSVGEYHLLEDGSARFSANHIFALNKALGLTPEDIYGDLIPPKRAAGPKMWRRLSA